MHLSRYINKLVFFRLIDKRHTEPFGLSSDLFLGRIVAVDELGAWVEWNRYPLVNKSTGERKFFNGELFIPYSNIASAFASEDFQRDVQMTAEAQRLANVEPAGEG